MAKVGRKAMNSIAVLAFSVFLLGISGRFAEAANHSELVNHTTLSSMNAGETRLVMCSFKNTGTTTWTKANLFKLGNRDPAETVHWGLDRVLLYNADSILPGGQKTFHFYVTAPTTPGLYIFEWQMLQEGVNWFGESTPRQVVQVGGGYNASQFLSQTEFSTMVTGETRQVSVTFRNMGNTTWTRGNLFKLGSRDPGDTAPWGMRRVEFSASDSVAPYQQKTFTFNVTAPTSPGLYVFEWRMLQEGVNWFGGSSPRQVIEVGAPVNAAQFVAQNVPTTMEAGETRQVSVTFRNTGNTTWNRAELFRLGSRNPANNAVWGLNRLYLSTSESIAPNELRVFTFNVTAPTTPGVYDFQWRMLQEGVNWFGPNSPNVAVQVVGVNDSQFIAQDVPTVVRIGTRPRVYVTFKNTGTTTWTRPQNYRLGSQTGATWGKTRMWLSTTDSIAPGEQMVFTTKLIPPAVPGTYDFQWRMVEELVEWFGPKSPTQQIRVEQNDAVFVSQDVPTTMEVGETRQVSVTVRNTGTTTWTRSQYFRLGSQNPQDNTTWGPHRIMLPPNESVPPGQQKTFTFDITAPTVPGTYDFQWRMVEEIVQWFGASSPSVAIQVAAMDDSQFISQSVPAAMTVGETQEVSVTFKNTGTTTWTNAGLYRLGSRNPQSNTRWGMARVLLPTSESVGPNQQKTFTFDITAPSTPGSYNFQWRMVKDGSNVVWFGPSSVNKVIAVSEPAPRIDSIAQSRISLGSSTTVVLHGENFASDRFYIPQFDGGSRVAPTITNITVSGGGTRADVRIDATNPASEGIWSIAAEIPGASTEEEVSGIDFRVVPAGPVIDAWTPSEPIAGGISALLIAGANLEGARVTSSHPGVRITDLDNGDDDALSGFLTVMPGVNPQQVELIVENHGIGVTLRPEIIDPLTAPLSHRMVCNEPPVFLQDVTFVGEDEQLPPPESVLGGFCRFRFTRQIFNRSFALELNLLDEFGVSDPSVLAGLGLGETRRFGVLTILISARVFVTVSFNVCSGFGFQICIAGYIGLQVPGIEGFVSEFACCFPGGCSFPSVTATTGSVSNISVSTSAEGAQCLNLTQMTGPDDGGRQFVDVQLNECCAEPPPITVTMSGVAFDGTFLSTPYQFVNRILTRIIYGPGNPCLSIAPMVVIDPGHGGTDGGNIGPAGTREADIALDVALRTEEMLANAGFRTHLTRSTDTFVGLTARPDMALDREADVFLSIHLNSAATSPCPGVNGTETYRHINAGTESTILANSVQLFLLQATGLNNRGVRTTGTAGVDNSGFVVLRPNLHFAETAACLAEISFLCNATEETNLNDPIYREIIATSLFEAISTYLSL